MYRTCEIMETLHCNIPKGKHLCMVVVKWCKMTWNFETDTQTEDKMGDQRH